MPRRRRPAAAQPPPSAALACGHDLRQSLQAARVQAHALGVQARQQGQAPWGALAEAMDQSLAHCSQLLDGLLASLGDIPQRQQQPAVPPLPGPALVFQPIDLAALLDALLLAWQAVAAQQGLWLRLACPPRPPAPDAGPVADALRLRRVLDNLLANALAHTRQGGVTVAWQAATGPAGAGTVLTVSDTGPGLGQPGAPTLAGHGLGLLIVRQLCGQMAIDVHLDAAPGGGTVARLAWPAASPTVGPAPTSGAAAAWPSGSGRPGA